MTGPGAPHGRARWALAAVFGIHAGVYGSFGPRLPEVKARLAIDDGTLGLALAAMAVSTFGGTRLAGLLLGRGRPPHVVVRVAVLVLCAALAGLGTSGTLGALVGCLAVMGLAMGVLDVAMNAAAVAVESAGGPPLLARLHGAWSGGLLLAGGVAAALTAARVAPAAHLLTVAAVLAALGAAVGTVRLPGGRTGGVGDLRAAPGARPAAGVAARLGEVAGWGLVAGCSFAAEGAAADWSAVYLHDETGASTAVAAGGFVAFAVGMTVSRLGADRVVARRGPAAVVRVGGVAGAAAVAAALAVPRPVVALAGLAVLGVALAPVVPVVFRAAGARGPERLAWVVTLAYLGTVGGPAVIGLAARHAGLRVGLVVVVVLALVIAGGAGAVGAAGGPGPDPPGGLSRRDRPGTTSGT